MRLKNTHQMTLGEFQTIKAAKAALRPLGISLTCYEGEYRVAFPGRDNEASAYYTNDRDDAVATGRAMAAHRDAMKGGR